MMQTTNTRTACTLQLHPNQQNIHERSLEATITEAIDESLSSFGDSFKQVIYFQLQKTFHIEKEEIPSRIDEFANAIEEMFGIGAKLIEIRIIEALHAKIEGFVHFPKEKDLMFTQYMEDVRRSQITIN